MEMALRCETCGTETKHFVFCPEADGDVCWQCCSACPYHSSGRLDSCHYTETDNKLNKIQTSIQKERENWQKRVEEAIEARDAKTPDEVKQRRKAAATYMTNIARHTTKPSPQRNITNSTKKADTTTMKTSVVKKVATDTAQPLTLF